jgi:Asp-tRNA(Asn)/Glu-tRNA(Gln) amidotransferase A subunit family amidase
MLIGNTNLATIAVRWHSVSELWGATINPWDRSRTPGASSGGEAAELAFRRAAEHDHGRRPGDDHRHPDR